MNNELQKKLAVLIDADNAQPKIIENLLVEIAKFGIANVKRIYGDWTSPRLSGWKEVLNKHAITPIQQFSYTVGKNSTDSAMIIDAMDLLYTERFDGFCLVSSDSDFTKLAARIRESGLFVYGFGEEKTPKAFIAACDRFIKTENLRYDEKSGRLKARKIPIQSDRGLIKIMKNAIEAIADETGWAYLGQLGINLNKQTPDFDTRTYGFTKLYDLVKALDIFETDERGKKNSKVKEIYIKSKPKSNIKTKTKIKPYAKIKK
ncbi:MAG: NYN domain-containing protein [Promethearchaeota archaeon]